MRQNIERLGRLMTNPSSLLRHEMVYDSQSNFLTSLIARFLKKQVHLTLWKIPLVLMKWVFYFSVTKVNYSIQSELTLLCHHTIRFATIYSTKEHLFLHLKHLKLIIDIFHSLSLNFVSMYSERRTDLIKILILIKLVIQSLRKNNLCIYSYKVISDTLHNVASL